MQPDFCNKGVSVKALFLFSSQCFPSLKKLQLPSLSKLPFKSIDQKFLDKSKTQLNAFLQVIAWHRLPFW